MTKEDLKQSHLSVWCDMELTTREGGEMHAKVSIEYAISVLEDIRAWWEMGSENYARLENKITELKSLIQ